MEELLADDQEGQQRLREAQERKEHWLAGRIGTENKKTALPEIDFPANAEGGKAAMMTEDEVENLEKTPKHLSELQC